MVQQDSVHAWLFVDGPDHIKPMQPFQHLLVAEVKSVFRDGVECNWPQDTRCVYKGKQVTYKAGKCRIHALIGVSCNDQPAAMVLNGHASHTATMACRLCGNEGKGSTSNPTDGGAWIGKGASKFGRHEKNTKKAAKAAAKKRGAVTWWHVCTARTAVVPDMEKAMQKVELAHSAGNKTALEKVIKENGWRERTFVWDLHFLYGFDPLRDVVIDGMHCLAGCIRDHMRARLDLQDHVRSLKSFDMKESLKRFCESMPGV